MKIGTAIKMIMKNRDVTQMQMATMTGAKRQSSVSTILNNNNLRFDTACEMLALMGYEITVQPKKPGKRPEGQIVITMEDED